MVIGGNKMRAECQDVYMIRTPSLSLEYLEKYEKQEKDIYDFISQDKELDQFFRKALLVSSPTLYKNYINKPTDKKKYEKLKESLLKYFLRSIGRPTPYGYFAEVSLGQFGNETELERGDQILDIRVDNNWINQVVQVLEKHEEIQKRLKVRYNTLCYISGDRVKNPYFTNYGKAETGQKIIVENSIRYTKLNDLVKKEAVDFISLLELSNKVKLVYEDTPEVVIWKTLLDMLKSEYLISNLRTPAYCKNTLKYLIQELKTIGYSGEYFVKLESILTLLEKFREKENLDILIEIYATMEKIGKNKNYLIINLGDKYKKNTLDVSIKKQVEKLSEILYKIPVIYDSTYKLKEKFIETYGTYVEVPLTQIIDKNGFNGERLIELGRIESTREEKVIHIIDHKIQQALLNQEEVVNFVEEDFNGVCSDLLSVGSYDINFMIMKNEKEYKLWLGPNFGSSRAGAMVQRFSQCLPNDKLEDYNRLYEKDSNNHKEYEIVEIREFKTYGIQENVINTEKNCNYYMTLGMCSKEIEKEISLEDIYIGIDDNKMYICSKKLGKRLKFVTDNMLNPILNNGISRLLLGISQEYNSYPLARLSFLPSELYYKYIPRVQFEGIVVLPRKWVLDELDLSVDSWEEFKTTFKRCRSRYKLDSILYCVSADNRIIVNLDREEYYPILYHELKKRKKLEFSELETGLLNNLLVKDDKEKVYVNECVFSVLNIKKEEYLPEKKTDCLMLCEEYRRKLLCEDGWIYFKLYGIGNRENEIISVKLPELLAELNCVEHFFLRYVDNKGEHLRIRIKFENSKKAYEKLPRINKWIDYMMRQVLINDVTYDIYFREINRYGGKEIIEFCEKIFFKDSLTVEKILSYYDLNQIDNIEKSYIIGITFILKNLTKGLEEMFQILDSMGFQNNYRKEYREESRCYLQYVRSVLNECEEKYLDVKEEHLQEKRALKIYAKKLENQIKLKKNTNKKENIILSIIHMYCNRITGNRIYENKYLAIVRHALYQILQQEKHYPKIASKDII